MDPLPPREQFYELRDRRTTQETGRAGALMPIAVQVPGGADYAAQATAVFLVNILSRFCRDLTLCVSPVATHARLRHAIREDDLGRGLLGMARRIDPYGDFRLAAKAPPGAYIIDVNPANGTSASLVAAGVGWNASVGSNGALPKSHGNDPNPVGPAAAACLAASHVFRLAFQVSPGLPKHVELDLWQENGLPGPPGPSVAGCDIGNVLMAGAGGVGGSLAYLASTTRLKGTVAVVDHDRVDYTNLNRTLPFEASHARAKSSKVTLARLMLHQAGLRAFTYPMLLDEFYRIQPRLPGDTDVVLALANEHHAYRILQSNYPPDVMHASTSPNWLVACGWHQPIVDPCIAGVYPDDAAPMRCETGSTVDEGVERNLGSLPFMAPFAATVLLAQILRRALGATPPSTVFRSIDLLSTKPQMRGFPAPDPEGCMCKHQDPSLHRSFLHGAP